MTTERRNLFLFGLLSLAAYVALGYFFIRPDLKGIIPTTSMFAGPLSLFLLLFFIYILVINEKWNDREIQIATAFSIVFRILLIFSIPAFTDDYFRFLWDGDLVTSGINPYSSLPSGIHNDPSCAGENFGYCYAMMNSKNYFSVYPPLLQFIFGFASLLSPENIYLRVIILKIFIVAFEVGSILILKRLLAKWNLPLKHLLVYAWNPLVIFELSGNLHFEGLMIFFLFAFLLFVSEKKWILAGLMFSGAVSAKLLPLMLLPFLPWKIGWKNSFLVAGITVMVFCVLFIPFYEPGIAGHFLESLQLYFISFEFNSSLYYLGIHFFGTEAKIKITQALSILAITGISFLSVFKRDKEIKNLPSLFLIAFTIYFLCATTIHPWYLTTLVALGALSGLRFPILWSFFLLLTYFTYYHSPFAESTLLIVIEYSSLFLFIFFECYYIRNKSSFLSDSLQFSFFKNIYLRTVPARMKTKKERIINALTKDESILDIGTGNGALCSEIKKSGFDVTSCDIQNRSLFENISPEIFDGKTIPFPDKKFQTSLLITVLHHSTDPNQLLKEAKRVSSEKIIVMEDVYSNSFQKYLTWFTDSVVNLEFFGHPHNNKTMEEWRKEFKETGLEIVEEKKFRTLVFFTQVIFVLRVLK